MAAAATPRLLLFRIRSETMSPFMDASSTKQGVSIAAPKQCHTGQCDQR